MKTIRVGVKAYILSLFPMDIRGRRGKRRKGGGPALQLQSLAAGLAVPSFWTTGEIREAFTIANRIWAQAAIEFGPVKVSQRTEAVPADEKGMWIQFVNRLSPSSEIAVAFVHDLPSNEGGWGGGRVAAIAWTKNAIQGFHGRILAHELGHVLFNSPDHEPLSTNLMYGQRHHRVVTADLLNVKGQKERARKRAQSL